MASSAHFCPHCGGANLEDALDCFACGESLATAIVSPTYPSKPATLLKGRYRLGRQLGRGGMGAVYRVEDTLFQQKRAIKEMSQTGLNESQSSDAARNFQNEAHLLAGLAHPNLPTIHDYFSDAGRWYLVMDYIEGQTLEEWLDNLPAGKLPLEIALKLGRQLCAVLDYLHTRQPPIIFRDLKPANIMWTPDEQVFLIDFGIARFFKPGQARDTVSFGSAGYAAPEQYGRSQTTARSDLYSLGAVLHQCLSGNDPANNSPTPFDFPALTAVEELQGTQQEALQELLRQLLALQPEQRPGSANEVERVLERIENGAVRLVLPGAGGSHLATSAATPAPARGTTHQVYRGHSGAVRAITWSPDNQRIASAGDDGSVQVWDATQAGSTLLIYKGHSGPVNTVSWSPDGRHIATGSSDRSVQVWEALSGRLVLAYRKHTESVTAVNWSHDGQRIASGSEDRSVQIWSVRGGNLICNYKRSPLDLLNRHGHSGAIRALVWSNDDKYVASGGVDRVVQVWHALDGDNLTSFRQHSHIITSLAWAPYSQSVASASYDGTVHVWTAWNGYCFLTFEQHSGQVLSVAWSPTGDYLASGGTDQEVQVWGSTAAQYNHTFRGHNDSISSLSWSPNGQYLASGSLDGTVRLWSV